MGKTFLITRITYKRAQIHTPDNFFICEFDNYYDLMQHLRGQTVSWPYKILHDRIYHTMAETVKHVRDILQPEDTSYYIYKDLKRFDIRDDTECVRVILEDDL